MILNSKCEQVIKVHLGMTMINLTVPLLINEIKKEILHCENKKEQRKNLLNLSLYIERNL